MVLAYILVIFVLALVLIIVAKRFIVALRRYFQMSRQARYETSIDNESMRNSLRTALKQVRLYLILLIVISSLLFASTLQIEWHSYSYEYEVTISSENEENFTLLIPFPLNDNDISVQFLTNLTVIGGNCTYEIEETIHGKALNITGNKSIRLLSKGNEQGLAENLSMYNGTTSFHQDEFWIFSDTNNKNGIDLRIYFEAMDEIIHANGLGIPYWISGGGQQGHIHTDELADGWQLTQGSIGELIFN